LANSSILFTLIEQTQYTALKIHNLYHGQTSRQTQNFL